LSGKIFANCRTCGVRFEIERPWSINPDGHVIVPRVFSTVSSGDRSVREEVDVFLCQRDLEAHFEKIVAPRTPHGPAPEKLAQFHCETSRGRIHSLGHDVAEAWENLPRDRRQLVSREQWTKFAVVCTGV